GNIIKSWYATSKDSTYNPRGNIGGYISYSRSILSSDQVFLPGTGAFETKWALIKPDGNISNLPSFWAKKFASWVNGFNDLTYTFVLPNNKVTALLRPNPDDPTSTFRYSQFDLVTGNEKVLLNISPANKVYYPHFVPEDINISGDTISFLV